MNNLKVTIVGAGSANFGLATLHDLLTTSLSAGGRIAMVDLKRGAAEQMAAVAERMANHLGVPLQVEAATDRTAVLGGTDVVIIAAEMDRIARWRRDWEIPFAFGIKHTLGENRGPAGLSHTLRTVPLVLDICKDVERLAPQATVLVMTNPEDRIAYAISRYTGLRAYGYCDGLWDFKHNYVEPLMKIPGEQLYLEAAGINHAVWITRMADYRTGEDLYPRFVETARKENFQPFGRHLYEQYGLWPHENDEHYGEYFSNAHEYMECKGYDFDAHLEDDRHWKEMGQKFLTGTVDTDAFIREVGENAWRVLGDTPPSLTIEGIHGGRPRFLQNANLQNNGLIPGLPDDMIVEVPGVATPTGIHGVGPFQLPTPLLAFLYREGEIQKLTAEAAYEGSREKALLALEMDSHVNSSSLARDLLEAFLDEHKDFIPAQLWKGLKGR